MVTMNDQRNALGAAYEAANKVCSTLADDTSFRADSARMITGLLEIWSRRIFLNDIPIQTAHEMFDDAGLALAESLRLFDEALGVSANGVKAGVHREKAA